MIRMQKQKEEAKKEAERSAAMEVEESKVSCSEPGVRPEGGLGLIGSVGGIKLKQSDGKKAGKKRTPGEIRIQKGELVVFEISISPKVIFSHKQTLLSSMEAKLLKWTFQIQMN